MKRIVFLLVILMGSSTLFSQELPKWEDIVLVDKKHYNAEAESAALAAANYILGTLPEDGNTTRVRASAYLLRWISGTPDYPFEIQPEVAKLTYKNTWVLPVYLAAMARYSMEHKKDSKDLKKVQENALKGVATYMRGFQKALKLKSVHKKFIEADEKGNLEAFMKES